MTSRSQALFDTLIDVLQASGITINPNKVHPPQTRLSIMGIVVDVSLETFSIESEKLN